MRVFCRFAPPRTDDDVAIMNDQGVSGKSTLTVADPTTGSAASVGCHAVFPATPVSATQTEVFAEVAAPLIDAALRGEDCALLAFGQTASGKTHTMFGPDGGNVRYFHSVDARGVIPRLASDLYEQHGVRFVEVSYLELYNEVVTDMVAKQFASAQRQDKRFAGGVGSASGCQITYKATERGKLLRGTQRVACSNGAQCLQVIEELSALRHTTATEYNARSSRSHVILQLQLHDGGNRRAGTITLVDLAGSESLRPQAVPLMPGADGVVALDAFLEATAVGEARRQQEKNRFLETKRINTSLFTLKKVVHALRRRDDHVAFKESLLTSLLESALRSPATALVVCCSSERADIAETLTTLRFANDASRIPPEQQVAAEHYRKHQERQRLRVAAEEAAAQAPLQFMPEAGDDRSARGSFTSHVLNGGSDIDAESADCFAAVDSGCDESCDDEPSVADDESSTVDLHPYNPRNSSRQRAWQPDFALGASRSRSRSKSPAAEDSDSVVLPSTRAQEMTQAARSSQPSSPGVARNDQRRMQFAANESEIQQLWELNSVLEEELAEVTAERNEARSLLHKQEHDTATLVSHCRELTSHYDDLNARFEEALREIAELKAAKSTNVASTDVYHVKQTEQITDGALSDTTNAQPTRKRVVAVCSPATAPAVEGPQHTKDYPSPILIHGINHQRRRSEERISSPEQPQRGHQRGSQATKRLDPLAQFEQKILFHESPEKPLAAVMGEINARRNASQGAAPTNVGSSGTHHRSGPIRLTDEHFRSDRNMFAGL